MRCRFFFFSKSEQLLKIWANVHQTQSLSETFFYTKWILRQGCYYGSLKRKPPSLSSDFVIVTVIKSLFRDISMCSPRIFDANTTSILSSIHDFSLLLFPFNLLAFNFGSLRTKFIGEKVRLEVIINDLKC